MRRKGRLNIDSSIVVDMYVNRKMTMSEIAKHLGCSRRPINRILEMNDIPIRNMSDTLKERYKNMSQEDKNNYTKAANIAARKEYRVNDQAWYRTHYARLYRHKKNNQTPTLTENEKKKIELYYYISQYLGDDFHVDHIHPLSKGGLHHPDNLQILAQEDNQKKSNKVTNKYVGFRL